MIAVAGVAAAIAIAAKPDPCQPDEVACNFADDLITEPVDELGELAALGVAGIGGMIALVGAASTPTEPPAPIKRVEPALTLTPPSARPLPEVATDARTMQLAKQARGAALQMRCTTVAVLLDQIRERDASYADALITTGVLAPCS